MIDWNNAEEVEALVINLTKIASKILLSPVFVGVCERLKWTITYRRRSQLYAFLSKYLPMVVARYLSEHCPEHLLPRLRLDRREGLFMRRKSFGEKIRSLEKSY